MMGGTVAVHSGVNQGSRFSFDARFGQGEEMIDAQPLGLTLRGVRVLVVDDNATNRRILEEVLTHWQAVPTLAVGGVDALAWMVRARDAGEPFDVALLDVNMPDMDGFTLAERMREMPDLTRTPILMLSSADYSDSVERCRTLGLAAYISKPVTQRDLHAALLNTLGAAPRADVPAVPRAMPAPVAARALRVLLAEDNAVNQMLAIRLLEKAGHEVRLAEDGRQAVALYRQERFDVICMDLQMPEMGGLEATAEIRRLEEGTDVRVPIVAMTAHAMQGDRQRCLEAGMDGYVSKPIRREKLEAELNRVLLTTAPGAATRESRTPPEPPPMQLRFQDEPDLLRELAAVFLEDCPLRLSAVADALAREDAPALAIAVHTMKGAVSVLCRNGPTLAVRELEAAASEGDLGLARVIHGRVEQQLELLRQALAPLLAPAAAGSGAV
jgi:CheY-like chemotaxis protein